MEPDEFDPVDNAYYSREHLSKYERDKMKHRQSCEHTHFITRCSLCGEILASDVHVRYHHILDKDNSQNNDNQ